MSRTHQILIIDDNPEIHSDFQKILASQDARRRQYATVADSLFGRTTEAELELPPYDLRFANRGQDGLEILRSAMSENVRFSMAYVDVRMPNGWDGIKTIEHLWKADPELQVVICTAHSDYSWEDIHSQLGQSSRLLILKKPFDPAEVRQLTLSLIERANAEVRLREAHEQLTMSARSAGMAEVATGVLHNVGNILNSVNTSCTMIEECLQNSRLSTLGQAARLMDANKEKLADYLANDVRGRELPKFLAALANNLDRERVQVITEVQALRKNIEHIRAVVKMQQKHAATPASMERFEMGTVVHDAIAVVRHEYASAGVELVSELYAFPPCKLRKHEVIQLLVNLLQNALQATLAVTGRTRRVVVRSAVLSSVLGQIEVIDNGIGIAPDVMPKLFRFGFSTRTEGNGFGLHTSANHAKEMGGSVSAASEGLDCGATFTFQFPLERCEG